MRIFPTVRFLPRWSDARATVVGLSLGLACAVVPAYAADDEEERAAAASEKQQPQGPTGADGVKYTWRPYIETEGGYDSNPDNLFSKDPSSFVKLEGGLKASVETANQYYGLTLKGRFIDFVDFEKEIQHRTDFKAAVDTSFNLSENSTLKAGTYFLRDLISLARADIYQSYLEYALRMQDWRLKLLAKSHVEHNFDDEEQGDNDFDNFSVSRAKAFDYSRTDGQVSLLTFTRFWLQPFVIYDFADVDYYNQVAGVSIDRNADEQYGIVGARLQFSNAFRIDVGWRHNDRKTEDREFRHISNDYIDINLFWQPFETFTLTGIVERYVDEPSTSFGIAQDVHTYGLTMDWDIAPKWRLAGTAYYDREDAFGEDDLKKKVTTTLSLSYYPDDNIELFVSGLTKWVGEEFTEDDYERYKIGTGARIKF